jgi:hypothetical protein
MNPEYEAILQAQQALVPKWDETGLLVDLSDSARVKMAVALENTRLAMVSNNWEMERQNGLLLPLVRLTFAPLFEQDKYRVMLMPTTLHFETPDSEEAVPIAAKTVMLDTLPPQFLPYELRREKYYFGIDEEAEITLRVSEELRTEILTYPRQGNFYYFYIPIFLTSLFHMSEIPYRYMSRFAILS